MRCRRLDTVLAAARKVARQGHLAAELVTAGARRDEAFWLRLSRSREALVQARFAFEHSRAILCARPDERSDIEAVRAVLSRAVARVNDAESRLYAASAAESAPCAGASSPLPRDRDSLLNTARSVRVVLGPSSRARRRPGREVSYEAAQTEKALALARCKRRFSQDPQATRRAIATDIRARARPLITAMTATKSANDFARHARPPMARSGKIAANRGQCREIQLGPSAGRPPSDGPHAPLGRAWDRP